MDVRLSPEQRALRDSAASAVARLGPTSVAALDDGERAAKLDAAVAAAGWRELRAADDTGGPWASGVEVAVVAEELAGGLADTAFLGPTLAAELRRAAGGPPATEPETVLLTADLSALGTDPVNAVAIDAAGARSALVLIADGDRYTLGTVARGPATTQVDLTRAAAAALGPVNGLDATQALDEDDVARALALGLSTTCADLVGGMHGATRLATEYAKERRQYGAPIGSFQAVQHLLADAHVVTEGARSISRYAAWAVDALAPQEALTAAATAKAYAARAARDVGETAIQVHGGIGNTWDCLAHVFLRRALLSADVLGGVDASLDRVLAAHVGGSSGLR